MSLYLNILKTVFCYFSDETCYKVTTRVQMPENHEDYVVQKIQQDRIFFENNVIQIESSVVFVKKNSIVLIFNVQDMWDVETIKFSIATKLFTRRFIYWLQDSGLSLSLEEQKQVNVEIIDIIEERAVKEGKWHV